jgi:hypothetical protein
MIREEQHTMSNQIEDKQNFAENQIPEDYNLPCDYHFE